MTKLKESWRAQRRTVFGVIGVLLLVWLVAAPIVQAQQRVRVVGGRLNNVVRVSGQVLDARPIAPMGLFEAAGTAGNRQALAVRNFAGGGGFEGAGNCTPGVDPEAGNPLPNVVNVENTILTAIILTGNGTVTVTAQAVGAGQVPLANFEVNAQNPNVFVGLGNGLTITSTVTFTGSGPDCNFIVIGQ